MINKYIQVSSNKIAKIIATFFYSGTIKYAPGTLGTIAGLFFYIILMQKLPFHTQFVYLTATIILGYFATKRYINHIIQKPNSDPKEVVIDEVIAIFLINIIINYILHINNQKINYKHYFITFIIFRTLDITKIYPISWFDKNVKGPFGIILDDIIAAIFTILISIILFL
jgi:phosphatidylglycerophosphatase A